MPQMNFFLIFFMVILFSVYLFMVVYFTVHGKKKNNGGS
uniref:ATPase subunit 8 n=1 Tax=Aplidium tabarquensis TaxID=1256662 RepID=A0A024GX55_9ASCI|nr:ATPase subunit 8 [Aplidium tabarquensis]